MIFTWSQVASFFGVLLLIGWLLYPSEYTRGLMHRQEGDRSTAIAFFSDYLARHPGHKGATQALSRAYEAAGRPEESVELHLAFYRHRRGDAEAGERALQLLERAGLAERAAAFRWELFEDLKGRPAADRRLLESLAYQAYQDASSAQDDAGSQRALAALAAVGGEGQGYRSESLRLHLARRDFGAALAMLGEESARKPRDAELRRTMVRIHRLRKDPAAALDAIAEGLKAIPDETGLLGDRVALRQEQRQWEAAVEDLRRLARLQPKEAAWPRELGRSLMEAGRFDEGLAVHRAFLERGPSDKERWWTVIYAFADRGRHGDAAAELERFCARFPDDESGLDMLVYSYETAGRLDRAIAALGRRFARVPGDLKRGRALASLLSQEERFAEAAAAYERLVAAEPADPSLWTNLAYLYAAQKEHRKAADVLERYLARFPGDPRAVDDLAGLYITLGERAKAIALLRRAVLVGAEGPSRAGVEGSRR